jgi:hypothetical protein
MALSAFPAVLPDVYHTEFSDYAPFQAQQVARIIAQQIMVVMKV